MIISNSRGKTQKDGRTKRIGDSAPLSPFVASRPSLHKSEATHFGWIWSDSVGFTPINPMDRTTLRKLPPNPSKPCLPSSSAFIAAINPTEVDSIYFDWSDSVGFAPANPLQNSITPSLQNSKTPSLHCPTSLSIHQSPRKRFDLVGFSRIGPAICDSGALFQTSGVRRLSGFPIRARQRHRTWLISKNGILVATDR